MSWLHSDTRLAKLLNNLYFLPYRFKKNVTVQTFNIFKTLYYNLKTLYYCD